MNNPFLSRVGGTLSADIAVPEHERELRFYSRVLTTGETPLWREDLMNNSGTPVIGLGARSTEYEELPLQWMPHIQVADVATSAARALELGGSELMHGKDDGGNSQWAVLLDPNGAAFGLIPVVSAESLAQSEASAAPDPQAPVGCISWVNLTVFEASATCDFYRQVIGWSVREVEVEDTNGAYADYLLLGGDGNPAAGISHARGANLDLPPVWMLHLPVGDLAETLRRVVEEGGTVLKEAEGGDGEPEFAAIEDPVGARLVLVAG